VARDVFRRYEDAGMRFDHYECGEFYHRGLAAFAVYNASFGIAYDGFSRVLRVRPPDEEHAAQFLVALPSGCLVVRYHPEGRTVDMETLFGDPVVERVVVGDR
jgi:hypothetical protein